MENNETLCKLLGIEAQVLLKYLIGDEDDYFEHQDTKEKIKEYIADLTRRSPINGRKFKVLEEVEVYPNMTRPENFVKLIELQVSNKLIVGRYLQGSGNYGVPFSNQWYDRESFFAILTDFLSRTDECFARNKNKIKQQAQNTQWVY